MFYHLLKIQQSYLCQGIQLFSLDQIGFHLMHKMMELLFHQIQMLRIIFVQMDNYIQKLYQNKHKQLNLLVLFVDSIFQQSCQEILLVLLDQFIKQFFAHSHFQQNNIYLLNRVQKMECDENYQQYFGLNQFQLALLYSITLIISIPKQVHHPKFSFHPLFQKNCIKTTYVNVIPSSNDPDDDKYDAALKLIIELIYFQIRQTLIIISDQMSQRKGENVRQTFHGFQSERQQTTHSLQSKSNSRIKSGSEENNTITITFPIQLTIRTMLLQFRYILKKYGYKCVQICEKQLLIVRLTFLDRFKKLFCCQQPPKYILTVTTHEFKSRRSVTIKPLKSNTSFSYRQTKLHEIVDEVNEIASLLSRAKNLSQQNLSQPINELDSEYNLDFYSLESTSYYMFSKILVDSNYSLGKKMATLIERIKDQNRIQDLKKQQLVWLSQSLNQISDDMLQSFNCSRKELLEILCYCRKSVEEYMHNLHYQQQVNQLSVLPYESQEFPSQKAQLTNYLPLTTKQLLMLESASTSMDMFKYLFLACYIFKAEVQIKLLNEETKSRCLSLIKTCFASALRQKTRILRNSGYPQQQFDEFISIFAFDEQLTF